MMASSRVDAPYYAPTCDGRSALADATASSNDVPRRPPPAVTFSLNCTLASDDANVDDNPITSSSSCRPPQQQQNRVVLRFRPDVSKKAAHWIDPPPAWGAACHENSEAVSSAEAQEERRTVPAPAHCTIECVCEEKEGGGSSSTKQSATFFLGGFQLVSNAKSVEVSADGTYLTTCRGLPSRDHPPGHFKVLYAVPGGPRPVRSVVLQLRTLQELPRDTTTTTTTTAGTAGSVARLVSMKLTARLPEPASPPADAASSSSLVAPDATTSLPLNPHSLPGRPPGTAQATPHPAIHASSALSSSSDAQVSSVPRSASAVVAAEEEEERLAHVVASQIRTALAPLEQQLQLLTTIVVDRLQYQNQLLVQQRELLEAQTREIRDLRNAQERLHAGGRQRLGEAPRDGAAHPSPHLVEVSEVDRQSPERDTTPEDIVSGPTEERA